MAEAEVSQHVTKKLKLPDNNSNPLRDLLKDGLPEQYQRDAILLYFTKSLDAAGIAVARKLEYVRTVADSMVLLWLAS